MTTKVVLGLPYLSKGPLLDKAIALQAPVLVSANAFSRWIDEGAAPKGTEYSRAQWAEHRARGNTGPLEHGRKGRMRRWGGWNLNSLANAHALPELWLDSAGFSMMSTEGNYPWSPENYIFGLCTKFPFTRFASLDYCVEAEIAHDNNQVQERISRTIALNYTCQMLANDAGIGDRLMPVIQGSNVDDYLRCFDAIEPMVGDERVIGVGSMCRRKTAGPDGIVAIVEALHARLPAGVQLHLFGLKSDGAEAVAELDGRVYSVDSQAYGVRARKLANERRRDDPSFSKTNAFVSEVMEAWYRGQVARMAAPNPKPLQPQLTLPAAPGQPKSEIDAHIDRAYAIARRMIEDGDMDPTEPVSHHTIYAIMSDEINDCDADDSEPFALMAA
ncbi:DUF7221 family queuine tRNA-ribosyltransferase-like protein [Erythrobacter aureus]|uniref:DeoxyPurine in DNA protein A domain-containing protein n=1 Tax=Erythrobacter aureus TaxID=2182384 RepID=A0A345YIY3_9SPHN|nr:hypothetical protein [Erythrobacter aureus]AXK43885.1 hypothetical protein DVR09_15635 [Erythrobacter aureus]